MSAEMTSRMLQLLTDNPKLPLAQIAEIIVKVERAAAKPQRDVKLKLILSARTKSSYWQVL